MLTRAVVVPHIGALSEVFDRFVITRELGVDLHAKTRELEFKMHIIGDALREHASKDIYGCLKVAVALNHDAEDEVLEVSICLLLLPCWSVHRSRKFRNSYVERA